MNLMVSENLGSGNREAVQSRIISFLDYEEREKLQRFPVCFLQFTNSVQSLTCQSRINLCRRRLKKFYYFNSLKLIVRLN